MVCDRCGQEGFGEEGHLNEVLRLGGSLMEGESFSKRKQEGDVEAGKLVLDDLG